MGGAACDGGAPLALRARCCCWAGLYKDFKRSFKSPPPPPPPPGAGGADTDGPAAGRGEGAGAIVTVAGGGAAGAAAGACPLLAESSSEESPPNKIESIMNYSNEESNSLCAVVWRRDPCLESFLPTTIVVGWLGVSPSDPKTKGIGIKQYLILKKTGFD